MGQYKECSFILQCCVCRVGSRHLSKRITSCGACVFERIFESKMSGMVKPKEYDWKDSNMALFGTDADRKVKKESAETEPAWQGAGAEVGLQIWRIVKFKVEHWDKEQYGEFYSGDSYIILNTYKEPEGDELKYDVHFWIG